jgi:hypothetical protein
MVFCRGPHVVKDLYHMFATMILMEYLTETSVSPLQANFVEVDKPLGRRSGQLYGET